MEDILSEVGANEKAECSEHSPSADAKVPMKGKLSLKLKKLNKKEGFNKLIQFFKKQQKCTKIFESTICKKENDGKLELP